MGYAGARSKSTDTWLMPSDEDQFADAVAADLPGAGWRCSHPGPVDQQPKHVHATVAEAMNCGGLQAFLDLPIGADPFAGESKALVQLFRSQICGDGYSRYFRNGRLATRWFEDEVGADMHLLLTRQRDLVWQALRRTTSPAHIQHPDGRPVSGKRIGPTALEVARAQGLDLGISELFRYRLSD